MSESRIPSGIDPRTLARRLADATPAPRKATRDALLALGPAAIPALAEALADRKAAGEATDLLSRIGGAEAAAALLGRLDQPPANGDPKDHIRLSVAHALRRMALPEAVPGLVRRLNAEKSATALAKVLVQALAATDSPEAIGAVMEVFLCDRRFAMADFVHLLEPLREKPKQAAVVFPAAAERLTDPVRAVPVLVLANAYAAAGLQPHPLAGRTAELVGFLGSTVPDLATLATYTLGLIGEPESFGALKRIVSAKPQSEDADPWLRAEAALALARHGVPEGVAALRAAAAGGETRDWARRQIADLGLPERLTVELAPNLAAQGEMIKFISAPDRHGRGPEEIVPALSVIRPWPGREEPVECRLFRYVYAGKAAYGLVGPVTAALDDRTADMSAEDALALYCGWDMERQGGFEPLDVGKLDGRLLASAPAKIPGIKLENPRATSAYRFGGRQTHLLFVAQRAGRTGVAIVGDCPPAWLAFDPSDPGAEERALWRAYRVHVGGLWFAAHRDRGKRDEDE